MIAVLFHHGQMLQGLWAVPAAAALCVYAWRMRARALKRWSAGTAASDVVRPRAGALRARQAAGGCAALALVVFALAGPAWHAATRAVPRRGRDVVFVLDVSRSMLAADAAPNRLERARLAIARCVDHLEGDRVALVAFAGSAAVRCPLTLDYAFFRMALDDVGPSSVRQGGTRIGDALDAAVAQMPPGERAGYRDIILITDGEDHGSSPPDAAARLDRAGVRLIAIGVGDEARGRRIPAGAGGAGAFVTHGGGEVWTRLEAGTLREMVARTSDGAYVNVGTGAIDIVGVYRRLVVAAERTQLGEQKILRYEEKFQIFLGAALAALFVATGRLRGRSVRLRLGTGANTVPVLLLVVLLLASPAAADTPRDHMTAGRSAYRAGDYQAAAEAFDKARAAAPQLPQAARNMGNALYRQGHYARAGAAFQAAASLAENPAERAACLHNAANALFRRADALRSKDPPAALTLYRAAAWTCRQALDSHPARPDTAHNLEVARRTVKALADEIKAADDKKKELLAEIRRKLEDLIRRQKAAAAASKALAVRRTAWPPHDEALRGRTDRLAADQKGITGDTRQVAELMKAAAALLPSIPPAPGSPSTRPVSVMDRPRRHVRAAGMAQGRADGELAGIRPDAAHPHQDTAAAELARALEAMPGRRRKGPDDRRRGEGDPRDDDSAKGEPREPQKSDNRKPPDRASEFRPRRGQQDPDEEFTAPRDSVDDILAEERRNNAVRARKRPATYTPGEKDW